MDFLRSIGGMFASGVVRLLVIAGTLVLVYLLFVRPALDTTNKAFEQFRVPDTSNQIQRSIQRDVRRFNRRIERQVTRSFNQTSSLDRQQRLLRCVRRAEPNAKRIQRCAKRF